MTAPPAPSCPPPPTPPTPPEPDRARAGQSFSARMIGGSTLLTFGLLTIVIAGLHLGRGALIPVTLAALVAFLLAPFV
ncbi:MAG TPA: hypothetical protein PKB10_13745, partial [Tepidisphaeraceae bacterium]|nr:hypothetical protein [Tepidisphaeraceae bacterium]